MSLFAVFGAVAVAGIGFAAYTASATTTINGSAGSFYLSESATVGSASLSSSAASCIAGPPADPLVVIAANLLPGDFCNFTVSVVDPGTLGGVGPYGAFSGCSGGCSQLVVEAYWLSPYADLAPLSGNADHYFVLVTDVGSGLVAETDSWTITITDTPA